VDAVAVDYDQGWKFVDLESGCEVGALLGVDADEPEGLVVLSAL